MGELISVTDLLKAIEQLKIENIRINEPLSLDELKQMNGKHAYVKSMLDGTVHPALIYAPNGAAYINGGVRYDSFCNYKKTWIAYLYDPCSIK